MGNDDYGVLDRKHFRSPSCELFVIVNLIVVYWVPGAIPVLWTSDRCPEAPFADERVELTRPMGVSDVPPSLDRAGQVSR